MQPIENIEDIIWAYIEELFLVLKMQLNYCKTIFQRSKAKVNDLNATENVINHYANLPIILNSLYVQRCGHVSR